MAELTTELIGRLEGERRGSLGRSPSRRLEVLLLAAGVCVAAGAAVVIASGHVAAHPDALALAVVIDVLGFAAAGVAWVHARPWNPLGWALLGFALVTALSGLSGSRSPVLFAIGGFAMWTWAIGAFALAAGFPSGRLDRPGKLLIGGGLALVVFTVVPELLVSPTNVGASLLARCSTTCPSNVLLVTPHPDAAHVLTVAQGVWRGCWGAAICVYLAWRFRGASRPRRRIVAPVYAVAVVYAAVFSASGIRIDALGGSSVPDSGFRIALVALRVALPIAFVVALLLAFAYAGTALGGLARALGEAPALSVEAAEDLVRRVLDDPHARLGFWVPRFAAYLDRHGELVSVETVRAGRAWRTFVRRDGPVLALEHDAALADDPELVDAVGFATMIALENRRLRRSLLDSISELRASRRRLVTAAAAERRRIERNLHDSAQQKLVALRIQLELAREQAGGDVGLRERLGHMGDELTDALDELRAIAHGIYPQLLTDEGLGAALRDAARHLGVPVRLEVTDVTRQPEEVEAAVYYTCLEALQNVVKHGGEDVTVSIGIRGDGQTLSFRVEDDGSGFAAVQRRPGGGLTNMVDRIGAVGGSLAIRSTPGVGTTVEGRVPLASLDREEAARARV